MTYNKVRKGSIYRFEPVLFDHELGEYKGQLVRVVELPGCPRYKMPNSLAHIELLATGKVLGIVCTNSLVKEQTK